MLRKTGRGRITNRSLDMESLGVQRLGQKRGRESEGRPRVLGWFRLGRVLLTRSRRSVEDDQIGRDSQR